MQVIRWMWQLPQNLVGFCLTRKPKAKKEYKDVTVYFTNNVLGCGVSLGDYIVLDESFLNSAEEFVSIKHEYGHHKQSLYLGPLYLLVVGLWSAIRNRWDVMVHRSWTSQERTTWYYTSYPENWADRLGGVGQKEDRGIVNA